MVTCLYHLTTLAPEAVTICVAMSGCQAMALQCTRDLGSATWETELHVYAKYIYIPTIHEVNKRQTHTVRVYTSLLALGPLHTHLGSATTICGQAGASPLSPTTGAIFLYNYHPVQKYWVYRDGTGCPAVSVYIRKL